MVLNGQVLVDRVIEKVLNQVVGQECALTGIPRKVSVWSAFCATMALLMANLHAEPCFTLVFDCDEMIEALEAAIEGNITEAQWLMSRYYAEGDYVDADEEMSHKLLRAAADGGHEWAQLELADYYASGVNVPQNFPEAVRYYSLAAKQGSDMACFHLAKLYAAGDGVKKNESEAVRLMHLAADRGYEPAEKWLASREKIAKKKARKEKNKKKKKR